MSRILRLLGTPAALRRVALASIVANVGIVITGGVVRLTGSGLGCPTWPRCTAESYVVTEAMGGHGLIEFGNRLLTFVVGLVAVLGVLIAVLQRPRGQRPAGLPLAGLPLLVLTRVPAGARPGMAVAALRAQPRTVWLAVLVAAGVVVQAGLGGLTVLTGLNPWLVGGHFLVSMGLLAAASAFWRATDARRGSAWVAPRPLRGLGAATVAASAAVLVLGTVVTGSGPHAGDANTPRNGLDPQALSQLHADGVFLLIGLSVGLWLALRVAGAPPGAVRAGAVLIGVELAQGLIGFAQYLTDLPEALVAAHMAGACAVWLATLAAYARLHGATGADRPDPDRPDLERNEPIGPGEPRQPGEPAPPGAGLPETLTLPARDPHERAQRPADDAAGLLGLSPASGKSTT